MGIVWWLTAEVISAIPAAYLTGAARTEGEMEGGRWPANFSIWPHYARGNFSLPLRFHTLVLSFTKSRLRSHLDDNIWTDQEQVVNLLHQFKLAH